ncbi:MAG TPA: trypsin-like serine protease [Pseudonocardiaceae bacterium]|jgi:hypothetical protein|nr:trypsin-like serine protease [Pseudonocardiaceae bacterium]
MARTGLARLVAVTVAVATALVTAGALATGTANAVADGRPATPGTYPFAVTFTMTNVPRPGGTFDDSACSGALIAPTWVITAGHCFHDIDGVHVDGPPQYDTTATLGTVDLAESADTSACLYDSGAPYFRPIGTKAGLLVSVENTGPDCPHDQLETTARADVIAKWIYQQIAGG